VNSHAQRERERGGGAPDNESIAAGSASLRLKAESASDPLGVSGGGSDDERILGEIHREGDVTPYHGPLCQLERDLKPNRANKYISKLNKIKSTFSRYALLHICARLSDGGGGVHVYYLLPVEHCWESLRARLKKSTRKKSSGRWGGKGGKRKTAKSIFSK
jgi:hypothetical protein